MSAKIPWEVAQASFSSQSSLPENRVELYRQARQTDLVCHEQSTTLYKITNPGILSVRRRLRNRIIMICIDMGGRT